MSNFPENPIDGALAEVQNADGSIVQYRYDKSEAAWKIVGKVGGGDLQVVTTRDVVTTSEPPLAPAGWTGFNVQEDIQYLTNQKLVNWFLAEQILKNKYNIEYHLWVGDGTNPPPTLPDGSTSIFWWRPDEEELYYWSEDEQKWLLTGLQEFDRGVIMSKTAPTKHPKFIGTENEELIDGDIWCDNSNPIEYILYIYDYANLNWVAAGKPDRPPIFSPDEPDVHPDFPAGSNDLEAGDLWYDTTDPDEIVSYIYDGADWIKVGGDYVRRKGGDSMEGPLIVTGERTGSQTEAESTIKVLNVDSGQNSSLNLKHNGGTKVFVGDDQTSFTHHVKLNIGNQVYAGDADNKKGLAFNSDGVEYFGDYTEDKHVATKKDVEEAIYHDRTDPDTNKYVDRSGDVMDGDLVLEESRLVFRNPDGNQTLIRTNRDAGEYPVLLDLVNNNTQTATPGGYDIKIGGATSYNQLRFVGQDTYLTINGGGGSNTPVKFHKDVDCGNNLFKKLGTPIDETDAANKKYVDDRDELLRQDIIELEEEIDAIAPSVEYGTWVWKNPASLGRPPAEGEFYLLDDAFATTQEYANTKHIVIHDDEYGGTGNHSWLEADPGKLIQLFDAADPDFLLGEITNTDTKDTYVIITVDLIQTNGTPADTVDSETGEFLTRINIFEKPSGGDASGFVLKTGDTMTGTLTLDDSRSIDVASGKIGNLKYNKNPRLGWGQGQVFVSAELVIQDPQGATNTGGILMNDKKIYDLANPEDEQDAATKSYVDAAVLIDISPDGNNRVKGEMWYNQNDGTLYLKVS